MSSGLLLQYAILGVIVLVSVWVVFRKLAPQLTNRWMAAASIHFGRQPDSRFAQALSRRLQPKQATGNCADGCSTCGACGPKPPNAAQVIPASPLPLNFRQRES
ncbi:MAG TPA: DUF6587 family protein [Rhodanobacteraceae bacterium]|nr:DUF6587 family protein [Rhodanobacteraceae bacterium]